MTRFLILSIIAALLPGARAAVERPNIIMVYTDDQGYQDLGCFGAPAIKTPVLDGLAAEGCRMTSFYAGAAVCTPSRAALMTGCYPARVSMHRGVLFPKSTVGMHTDEVTMAEVLRDAGYHTAMIGKWHLGHMPGMLPTDQGFLSWYGNPTSNDHRITPPLDAMLAEDVVLNNGFTRENLLSHKADNVRGVLMRGKEVIEFPVDHATWTGRYTRAAEEFIAERGRANSAGGRRPFFLYLAHPMPHVPLGASSGFLGKSEFGLYGDAVEEIDASMGRLLAALEKAGEKERTVICFASDNGPWQIITTNGNGNYDRHKETSPNWDKVGRADPLRESKATAWEGGMRVPGILWGPAHLIAPQVRGDIVSAMDLLPTFAEWAGAELPGERVIDGLDMSGVFADPDIPSPRSELLYYVSNGDLCGLRRGEMKVLRHGEHSKRLGARLNKGVAPPDLELFNLGEDIGERNNLAGARPETVEAMLRRMDELHAGILARQRPQGGIDPKDRKK